MYKVVRSKETGRSKLIISHRPVEAFALPLLPINYV